MTEFAWRFTFDVSHRGAGSLEEHLEVVMIELQGLGAVEPSIDAELATGSVSIELVTAADDFTSAVSGALVLIRPYPHGRPCGRWRHSRLCRRDPCGQKQGPVGAVGADKRTCFGVKRETSDPNRVRPRSHRSWRQRAGYESTCSWSCGSASYQRAVQSSI